MPRLEPVVGAIRYSRSVRRMTKMFMTPEAFKMTCHVSDDVEAAVLSQSHPEVNGTIPKGRTCNWRGTERSERQHVPWYVS